MEIPCHVRLGGRVHPQTLVKREPPRNVLYILARVVISRMRSVVRSALGHREPTTTYRTHIRVWENVS